ncbi:hypothetical protein C8R44DRAFT_577971, partial [Mycena epipterygia]
IFDTISAVLDRKNSEGIGKTDRSVENTRVMIMQMVNSLTSKLQIGSPMASLYLLDNPDHYTNYNFKPFWWRSYLLEVKKSWPAETKQDGMPVESSLSENEPNEDACDETGTVLLMKTGDKYLGVSNVDDYVHRPQIFENTSLYDFIQMTTRKKRTKKQRADFEENDDWLDDDMIEVDEEHVGDVDDAVSSHAFASTHELYKTHYIRCDRRGLVNMVPNFVGGSFPRVDQGDREFYCCTM